jgi:DNA polymerase-3 subunit beta
MQFSSLAGDFKKAVAIGCRVVQRSASMVILRSVRVDAAGDGRAAVTGTNLNCWCTGISAAKVEGAGAIAVDARLRDLTESLDDADEITIEVSGTTAVLHRGRAHWRLPTVSPGDLPNRPALQDHAALFELAPDDVMTLCIPSVALAESPDRPHLAGVFLHRDASDCLAAAGTDGVILMRAITGIPGAGALPPNGNARGIILPPQAVHEIRRLGRNGIALATDGRLVEVRTDDAVFTGKLIGGIYPDFGRIIPPPAAAAIEVDVNLLAAALARLAAASTSHPPVARLSWAQGDDVVALDLPTEPGAALDSLPAATSGSGTVAVQALLLLQLLAALRVPRVRIGATEPRQALLRGAPSSVRGHRHLRPSRPI